MGRTKDRAPKKRRLVLDNENDASSLHKAAIDTLLETPTDVVEAAAAEATRSKSESWKEIPLSNKNEVPEWLKGLGTSKKIADSHFQGLKLLHQTIKANVDGNNSWASWSGSNEDPRKRAFGFLPDTLGFQETTREFLDISTPWKDKKDSKNVGIEDAEERSRNNRAMVVLENLPDSIKEAIQHVCELFSDFVPEEFRSVLTYSSLIAAQPNLHCGRTLLPVHVDHPLKDGFGVVIVTVGIVGSGTILLIKSAEDTAVKMQAPEGYAYMLSDKARDSCSHGVLAHDDDDQRESLNLRFGLHDFAMQGLPLISSQKVLKYWETPEEKY
mmetsp:Transcript_29962/g.45423  ORF Transcript_29962/g.45423 Transcript_29962/m.45423 type:complete len:327 (+) Transcript_29962:50-1030(+)